MEWNWKEEDAREVEEDGRPSAAATALAERGELDWREWLDSEAKGGTAPDRRKEAPSQMAAVMLLPLSTAPSTSSLAFAATD